MRKLAIRLTAVVLISLMFFGMYKLEEPGKTKGLSKVTTNDLRDHIDINQIDMIFYNNGIGSYNNIGAGTSGLFWPKGSIKTAIFEDGLLFGGRVGATEIQVGGSAYRTGLQSGTMNADGTINSSGDSKFKIYKIKRGWETYPAGAVKDRLKSDYENWPFDQGAPYVMEGGVKKPKFIGDEVDFFVMNDGDPAKTTFLYGTQPMGIEIQSTIYGFNSTGDLGNMVFKKYKLINKGSNTIRDMALAYWSDPDLGLADDDFVGCDTIRSLGFCYNGDNDDGGGVGATYGIPPPAVGYDFFQGPVIPYDPAKYPIITKKNLPDSAKFGGNWVKGKTNLPLTSFSLYVNGGPPWLSDPDQGSPLGSQQFYWYMTSHDKLGEPFKDPNQANKPVQFCLPGDPGDPSVGRPASGWYEGAGWPGGQSPGDRRMLMSSGTFTFAPGDTQEVVVGIVIAKGTSNLNSVTVLKSTDDAAQKAYNLDFNLVQPPPFPELSFAALDRKVVLTWAGNAETYDAIDPLLVEKHLTDTTYTFEGYLVYQYSDETGSNPTLLATYDINNGITKVLDWVTVQGENVLLPIVVGSDAGLKRSFEVNMDNLTNTQMNNGSPYYFGVVAYAYCPNGSPKILMTTHKPVTVIPQSPSVGESYAYTTGNFISVTKSSVLPNDGLVAVKVVDPNALTGHDYEVYLSQVGSVMKWNLRDLSTNPIDTLFKVRDTAYARLHPTDTEKKYIIVDQLLDTINVSSYTSAGFDFALNTNVIDGFYIKVGNPVGISKIKEVVMTKDAGNNVTPVGTAAPLVPKTGVSVFGSGSAASESLPPVTSTRNWWIASIDPATGSSSMQTMNIDGNAGVNDFEITFTDTTAPGGSGFYSWSNLRPVIPAATATGKTKANPVGYNRLPFLVNNLTTHRRLFVKVFDDTLGTTGRKNTLGKRILDTTWTGAYVNKARMVADSVIYEEFSLFEDTLAAYVDPVLGMGKCRVTGTGEYPLNKLTLATKVLGDIPKPGTVIRINTWKPISVSDKFHFTATKVKRNDAALGSTELSKISVYPNPYFGSNSLEHDKYQRFVRFTNLPYTATIRLYTVAGVFVKRIDKNSTSPFVDWNLLNTDNIPVASGMFLAYVEIPGMGTKVLKIAVIQETPYIDRL